MNLNASLVEILTLISLVVGLLAVIRDSGKKQGIQEEKNKSMSDRIDKNTDDIGRIENKFDSHLTDNNEKMSQMLSDIGYIKGHIEKQK